MMRRRIGQAVACVLALAMAALLAAGCATEEGFSPDGAPQIADPEFTRTPPPLRLAEYTGSDTIGGSIETYSATAEINLSNLAHGYVAVKATSSTPLRFYVIKGSDQPSSPDAYFYPLDNDNTPNYYSLSLGNGDYYFIVMAEIVDEATGALSGARVAEGWGTVQLESEFAPFLINNREVDYDADTEAVQFSYELTQHCASNLEVAQQIYGWIQDNVVYDTPLSQQVGQAGAGVYLPDPDRTLTSKKGICYDYAALAATMLRANGIPCKLIKGDTITDETTGAWVYHAWNLIWLEETGWIAVAVPTKPNDWFRIDLTFAASGGQEMAEHINNDANYTQIAVS